MPDYDDDRAARQAEEDEQDACVQEWEVLLVLLLVLGGLSLLIGY